MKSASILTLVCGYLFFAAPATVYQFTLENIDGEKVSLSSYQGKVMVIVNVASKCGLTPQYKDLQSLYDQNKDNGLVVLGFPANNFAGQEPGSNDEIQSFCSANYGVTFPMFGKISVKGSDIHPLYAYLTSKEQNGVSGDEVSWNFQKYLIDRKGNVRFMIPPRKSVMDAEVQAKIKELLSETK